MSERFARRVITFFAIAFPLLLAVNEPPSPTLLNQCASVGLAGIWVAAIARSSSPLPRQIASLLGSVAVLFGCQAWSATLALPLSIAIAACATVIAIAAVACAGNAAARCSNALDWYVDFAWALCAAGVLSAVIGCLQVFAPDMPDGNWIARSGFPGRAVGNLRQPNHLASLALWSLVSVVALHEMKELQRTPAVAIGTLCLFGGVLSGSRTGILGVILVAGWGALDRRQSRQSRAILLATPLVFIALWLAMVTWAHATAHPFAGEGRVLNEGGDISNSRFAIWSNALAMILREPVTGVGFGEFNIAWTLTQFPDRPIAFFDHTHNLPLQLLVELGIPLGLLAMALLVIAFFQAGRHAWARDGTVGIAQRAAFVIVLMIGLHSMLEYPLWYAYFLLPAAFAWGFALARPVAAMAQSGSTSGPRASRALALAGLAMTIGAAAAALDYWRVVVIYDPPERAVPLEQRIERGQRSPLFGHHADYAAATAFGEPKAPLSPSQQLAFKRAPHQLLDVRLMIAWSQALAAQGEMDKARWLAARIREFRNPGADEFFAPCQRPELAAQAFQCQPPQRVVDWREFTQPR